MLSQLRIVHTSDVHLDDNAEGQRAQAAFAQVVDAVLAQHAQLFLIAGDLFDHNRVPGHVIDFVHAQLARVTCPTVIIPGNHDCYNERSILRRTDFDPDEHGIHLLSEEDGQRVHFDHLHATVWGRGMIEHEPANKPLRNAPDRHGDTWNIGMAHGFYVDYPETMRSSLITPDEIAASGFDYLALGHVHVASEIRHGQTLACYPGSPSMGYGSTRYVPSVAVVDLLPSVGPQLRIVALPKAE